MVRQLIDRINRRAACVVREWRIAFERTPLQLLKEYSEAFDRYHLWYYENKVHNQIRYLGLKVMKSVSDMWNYQEIIFDLKPALVVEFGTLYGGATLYFRNILAQVNRGRDFRVLSVDVDLSFVDGEIRRDPNIELLNKSSSDPAVATRITELRHAYPGKVFFILDSDHSKQNVLAELKLLRNVTRAGDYVIVEDSNINGHPVVPGWGAGPFEAIEAYFAEFPNDYIRDEAREKKFGFTYSPNGFLIRK